MLRKEWKRPLSLVSLHMAIPLTIEAEQGRTKHGSDGYGYETHNHCYEWSQKLKQRGASTFDDFWWEDPEDLAEWIETSEGMGKDAAAEKKDLERLRKQKPWHSAEAGMKLVEAARDCLAELELSDEQRTGLESDLNCYQEILADLKAKGVGFRFVARG